MPRANRYFLPGHVWHITHRCHQSQFLLKFARDRRCWRFWLFQARKRYGLCVLNYIVTCNHIHLLVQDRGEREIARSMQLIQSRTAQKYNRRKLRKGAFWEDRYHATAVDTDQHLARCVTYIDLNMVRAGAVKHPSEWECSGYREIQKPPLRYNTVDQAALLRLFGLTRWAQLQQVCREWVREAIREDSSRRDSVWSASLAVGRKEFLKDVKKTLGTRARCRNLEYDGGFHVLREPSTCYRSHSDS